MYIYIFFFGDFVFLNFYAFFDVIKIYVLMSKSFTINVTNANLTHNLPKNQLMH